MRRSALCLSTFLLAVGCSHGDRSIVEPPPGPNVDTLSFPDPTGSAHPGRVHFKLTRSNTSSVPSSADSALVRIRNASGFNQTYPVKIPIPGSETVLSAQVPSDTGYVVAILAFHGEVLDAIGSTSDNDTSITVLPEGNPTYTGTPVHVAMQAAPFSTGFSIDDGSHVTAGQHVGWWSSIAAPRDVFTDASSTWGCEFNGNVCAVYSYQGTIPNTPGVVWALETTWIADWDEHHFEVASDTIHVTIDQGQGEIDITFGKHH